ncbi:NUDIX hydrolase [Rhizobium sp. L1K21]|uniref:NUDIX hydrolase n=1 Tax=Rhizobium sp. L1K21 TaxID=2954933 RepID=UPI0020939FE8|nr:hypothetical protein [Rhizobium sp. L1K21]MCO6185734.1 hypothetical protein [Rhizobium sp. L1K21]
MSGFADATVQLPPQGVVVSISELQINLSDAPHPVAQHFPDEIEACWKGESKANPALYDGIVLLAGNVIYSHGRLNIDVHRTRFATLLWWRRNFYRTPYVHMFCMAVPMTVEGKLVAIKMAAHTANPGRIYCAAGTLDEGDLDGRTVDYDANMRRELKEETGLEIAGVHGLQALHENGRLVIFRAVELGLTVTEAEARIRMHMAVDHEKEIEGPVFVENGKSLPENFASFMGPIINWVLNEQFKTEERVNGTILRHI